MTKLDDTRPDLGRILGGLKDFQRDTVDYVFRRLYTDPDPASRFLIADEVGLGKTLVARGVIAKAIDHLWDSVERVNVVYICSNQAIARQNIDRLNITRDRQFQHASRATLLPVTLQSMRENRLNFVSLTPGTSFNLRSQTGRWEERAVLYCLLRPHWPVSDGSLRNVLRGNVRRDRWRRHLSWYEDWARQQMDPGLASAFYDALELRPELRQQYDAVAQLVGGRREKLTAQMSSQRNDLLGKLRTLLAQSSLRALQPQLVILDEFQRFRPLLEEAGDMATLAQEVFSFPNVRILLLSATPYKWYTLQGEEGEDHYGDFYETIEFLVRAQPGAVQELQKAVGRYRRALLHLNGDTDQLCDAKRAIETILLRVMVRTERLAASADRNGMLVESRVAEDRLQARDLTDYIHLDKIAQLLDAGEQIEYWKSSAYPLNIMDRYLLKDKLDAARKDERAQQLGELLDKAHASLLSWQAIESYDTVDPGNARLRALAEDSIETGNWRLLWMPASLPYYASSGPFAEVAPQGCTKSLVFSAWRLVPKTIAVLLSYEAERRMLEGQDRDFGYSELTASRRPLLNFTRSGDRLTGMPNFCLTYPCLTLTTELDPLAIACAIAGQSEPGPTCILEAAQTQIDALLKRTFGGMATKGGTRADQDWYWLSSGLLDQHLQHPGMEAWLADDTSHAWERLLDDEPAETSEGGERREAQRFGDHVLHFKARARQGEQLGSEPENLCRILAYVALASPAIVALRALLRVVQPQSTGEWKIFLSVATQIALAFRTLFNQPDAISLLQRYYPDPPTQEPYWQKVLRYCFEGNLQAVMDEYIHILYESLGLVGHDPSECAQKLGEAVQTALSLRAATLRFDEIVVRDAGPPEMESRGIRCRYALRYGSGMSGDWGDGARDEEVWKAFNSPFRPFVLATTSIGQEGLDFHQYCHRVVHWNLPSNPVDLEQREGRVHRYKGHVIRRNLGQQYGLSALRADTGRFDPWGQIFDHALRDRPSEANDLVPFWIYEPNGDAVTAFRIERRVPMLPLSREVGRLDALNRALAAYRCVIGQPRQQELLAWLGRRLGDADVRTLAERVTIDLSPPRVCSSLDDRE